MTYQATVYQVFIASPGSIAEERKIATEVVNQWNDENSMDRGIVLLPVRWETHSIPRQGDRPQQLINQGLLDPSDIVVVIFGSTLGQHTGLYASGTEEEYERALSSGKSVLLYFCTNHQDPDPDELSRVKAFKENIRTTFRGIYEDYNSSEDFKDKFRSHLHRLAMSLNGSKNEIPREADSSSESFSKSLEVISAKALLILLVATRSEDVDGTIEALESRGTYVVRASRLKVHSTRKAREYREWCDALEELRKLGLTQPKTPAEPLGFDVSTKGYSHAREIREELSEDARQLLWATYLKSVESPFQLSLMLSSPHLLQLAAKGYVEGNETEVKELTEKGLAFCRAIRLIRDASK